MLLVTVNTCFKINFPIVLQELVNKLLKTCMIGEIHIQDKAYVATNNSRLKKKKKKNTRQGCDVQQDE